MKAERRAALVTGLLNRYGTDVAAAIDGKTADWVKVRNVMIEQKGNWYTS